MNQLTQKQRETQENQLREIHMFCRGTNYFVLVRTGKLLLYRKGETSNFFVGTRQTMPKMLQLVKQVLNIVDKPKPKV